MRLVAIDAVEPGARLGSDVWGGSSMMPMLRAGVSLTPLFLNKLRQGGIGSVYIDDELSAGIAIPIALRESTQRAAGDALSTAFTNWSGKGNANGFLRPDLAREFDAVIQAILDDLAHVDGAMLAFSDLATVDAYTMQHSIDVTVLGLLMGRRLFREYGWTDANGERRYDGIDERLTRLGLGLLLSDIGKLKVPPAVLNKQGPLEAGEWEVVRGHPAVGVAMLGNHVSYRTKAVILAHHERMDGSGYPAGLKGEKIPQLGRIAAVADVFDAITSARCFRAPSPAAVGVEEIAQGVGVLFDPEVVAVFRAVVAAYPTGTMVTLSDGREGIVSHVPPERADRPTIRVITDHEGNRLHEPIEIQLTRHPELGIRPPEMPVYEIPIVLPPSVVRAEPEPEPEPEPELVQEPEPEPEPEPEAVAEPEPEPAPEPEPEAARTPREQPMPAAGKPSAPAPIPGRTRRVREEMIDGKPVLVDALTGFASRAQLDKDLLEAVKVNAGPSLLVIYDLDGTGAESCTSRISMESLLRRLSSQLRKALGQSGTCYRSREVEFTVLIYAPHEVALRLAGHGAAALGFIEDEESVPVRFGVAALPNDADIPLGAMIIADQHRKHERARVEKERLEQERAAIEARAADKAYLDSTI